jgi:hypothetical protein
MVSQPASPWTKDLIKIMTIFTNETIVQFHIYSIASGARKAWGDLEYMRVLIPHNETFKSGVNRPQRRPQPLSASGAIYHAAGGANTAKTALASRHCGGLRVV